MQRLLIESRETRINPDCNPATKNDKDLVAEVSKRCKKLKWRK